MNPGKGFRALINTRGSLGGKPGGVEKTLKSGAPRCAGRRTKQAQTDKRMAEGAVLLQGVWK